ncbi:DUF2953 domain-containing protein [Clostridium sp.]|jgi:hypothetical protein|uniref:DUF2953 domain-containing protein n=1 Tax=Clostridium sp. TaxID=1506 RepID=UPI002584D526|nr:DUF2953 domain-containing protein [Clostridium sp.]MDF2504779.1 hypothetical protein [Clostridium sp.]
MEGIMVALKILIIILFIVIALILMLLVSPYTYVFKGDIKENINVKFQIKWLFGILRFTCLKTSDNFEMKVYFIIFCIYSNLKKHKKVKKSIGTKTVFNKVNFSKVLNLNSVETLIEYFKYILLIVKPNKVKVKGIYGLEDPCNTGVISAIISMIKSSFLSAEIDMNPIFDEVILEISIDIKGKFNLLLIGFRTIKLLLNKDLSHMKINNKSRMRRIF